MFSKDDLDRLITKEAAPAVTLLLPTHAAGREIRQDPIRLRRLADNPGCLDDAELHRRAYGVVETHLSPGRGAARDKLDQALNDGSGRATTGIAQIIPAARHGRVDKLLLAAEDHLWGKIEERAETILVQKSEEPAAEDLLDAAAEMLLKGRRVAMLPKEELPEHGAATALFRY